MIEDLLFKVLFGLVNFVLFVLLLSLVIKRFGARLPAIAASSLFTLLAGAHGLSERERKALQAMARREAADPALYFVSPSGLARGLSKLRREAPSAAAAAEGLAERLFGKGRNS